MVKKAKREMTEVRAIVKKYLEDNDFDGLYNSSIECGCVISDLMPCEYDCISDCVPGVRVPCVPEECPVGGCDFHIRPKE